MKNGFFTKLGKVVRETGRVGYALSGKLFARVRQMSWLQIAMVSVGVALAIMILHLALFLFLVFMAIKLAVVGVMYMGGKQASATNQPHNPNEPYTIEMESPSKPG